MNISPAHDPQAWDAFLASHAASPFLQSWTMGEVYRDIGQEPVRLELRDGGSLVGICQAIVVPARRGRHLSIPYGPILSDHGNLPLLLDALAEIAQEHRCGFIRMSPFWNAQERVVTGTHRILRSPLHLLAEHVWYLPLVTEDPWQEHERKEPSVPLATDAIFGEFRKTTRNLIRRSQKEGVTIECSTNPIEDVELFIALHDETRKRHKFTPYSNAFFRAQVRHFAPRNEAIVYLARYQDEVIAASIHMQFGGETSYHHGASSMRFSKIPASVLLQWQAICDAVERGDSIYNFWGIAPVEEQEDGGLRITHPHHPFAGVTLFKTGFGGRSLSLLPCQDIPLAPSYRFTRAFEQLRKWKRGF